MSASQDIPDDLHDCQECGTPLELSTGPGRTRRYRHEEGYEIPAHLAFPKCPNCGAEVMTQAQMREMYDSFEEQRKTMIDNDTTEVIRTLLQWQERGLIKTAIQVRAPSGRIVSEHRNFTDIPDQAMDPQTSEPFAMRLEHVEVVYRLVPLVEREVARAEWEAGG